MLFKQVIKLKFEPSIVMHESTNDPPPPQLPSTLHDPPPPSSPLALHYPLPPPHLSPQVSPSHDIVGVLDNPPAPSPIRE